MLGVMYSGRVVLALNALSGKESLSYVINHSDAKLLFINKPYQQQYSEILSALNAPLAIIETDEDVMSVDSSVAVTQAIHEIYDGSLICKEVHEDDYEEEHEDTIVLDHE